jgi:hypothetical protein
MLAADPHSRFRALLDGQHGIEPRGTLAAIGRTCVR